MDSTKVTVDVKYFTIGIVKKNGLNRNGTVISLSFQSAYDRSSLNTGINSSANG